MIYILLGIIAVGILLITTEGKKILEWSGISLVVGSLLTIVALVIFLTLAFLKAHSAIDILMYFCASVIPLGVIIIAWKLMRFITPRK